jgi:hypothetical protein
MRKNRRKGVERPRHEPDTARTLTRKRPRLCREGVNLAECPLSWMLPLSLRQVADRPWGGALHAPSQIPRLLTVCDSSPARGRGPSA